MTVASPCVDRCGLDRDDVCTGCGRHVDEIMRWQTMPDAERRETVARAQQRMTARRSV